jgi:hypothetical protein
MTDTTVYLLRIDALPDGAVSFANTAYTSEAAAERDAYTLQQVATNQGKPDRYRVVGFRAVGNPQWRESADGQAAEWIGGIAL